MEEERLNQAWDYFVAGDLDQARSLMLDLEEVLGESFSFLNLKGYLYLADRDIESARFVFESYLDLARQVGDREQEHIGLHQLAMVYREQADYAQALALIEEEAACLEQYFSEDKLKWSVNHYEQGYLRLKMEQASEALPWMCLSLEAALTGDDLVAQACAYRGLAETYLALEQREAARNHVIKAKSVFLEAGDYLGAEEVEDLLANLV
ncbi:hypothetical protein [Streptococcus cuniculipharyngis]|uniref:Tetratricopeptide repeat protein n=1 Tax=Streptococcus cuniculipharyngis TaxID=1562651 RepID=A0A5C5S8C3_9STRE|nr:hypothetical protein [Streptococcus cuniculipharyngis]TWS96471.1 hypothetical protein FRX57_07180 [Streptococcus cuniculipharyngis]